MLRLSVPTAVEEYFDQSRHSRTKRALGAVEREHNYTKRNGVGATIEVRRRGNAERGRGAGRKS